MVRSTSGSTETAAAASSRAATQVAERNCIAADVTPAPAHRYPRRMELALPDDAGRTAASRPLRFAARACDLSLIAYLFGVLVIEIRGRLLGGDVFATRPFAGAQDPQEILAVLVAVVLLTDTLPMAIWGRSLGKAMLGLRAVRDGRSGAEPWGAACGLPDGVDVRRARRSARGRHPDAGGPRRQHGGRSDGPRPPRPARGHAGGVGPASRSARRQRAFPLAALDRLIPTICEVVMLEPSDELSHPSGDDPLAFESWYFDFTTRSGDSRRLRPHRPHAEPRAHLVLGLRRRRGPPARHGDRPRRPVAVTRGVARDPLGRALGRSHRRDAVRALHLGRRGVRGRGRRSDRGLRR